MQLLPAPGATSLNGSLRFVPTPGTGRRLRPRAGSRPRAPRRPLAARKGCWDRVYNPCRPRRCWCLSPHGREKRKGISFVFPYHSLKVCLKKCKMMRETLEYAWKDWMNSFWNTPGCYRCPPKRSKNTCTPKLIKEQQSQRGDFNIR